MQISFFTHFTHPNLPSIVSCLKTRLTSGLISSSLFREQPEHVLNPGLFSKLFFKAASGSLKALG